MITMPIGFLAQNFLDMQVRSAYIAASKAIPKFISAIIF